MQGMQKSGKRVEEKKPYHIPVLLKEAIDALEIDPSGTYVDCTFGGGGHTREILARLDEKGRLFAFDQDADAKANLTADTRLVFIPHNFRHLSRFLRLHHVDKVDGILADLGVSSHQFDEPERGFSIRYDAPLDMRMDRSSGFTASDLLQRSTAAQLQFIFQEYGEVTNAKTLAKLIEEHVRVAQIRTIEEFKSLLAPVVKGNPNKYFAQVFQALRIAVNDELGALAELLEQSAQVLRSGGRLVVITFHSIEDRMVKQFLRQGSEKYTKVDPLFGTKTDTPFVPVNKKPVEPSAEEIEVNPRSRSARLRAGVKR